jgi:hypothetical protein
LTHTEVETLRGTDVTQSSVSLGPPSPVQLCRWLVLLGVCLHERGAGRGVALFMPLLTLTVGPARWIEPVPITLP